MLVSAIWENMCLGSFWLSLILLGLPCIGLAFLHTWNFIICLKNSCALCLVWLAQLDMLVLDTLLISALLVSNIIVLNRFVSALLVPNIVVLDKVISAIISMLRSATIILCLENCHFSTAPMICGEPLFLFSFLNWCGVLLIVCKFFFCLYIF